MSHESKNRLANTSLFVWTGALLMVSWTTSVLGQTAPADDKAPLNSRVLRSCFAINTHFWQNQPLEELDLVEDIGATWIRDEGNWSGEDAEPGVYNRGELRKLERWVNEAHRRGFKVMVHLGSTYEGLRRARCVREVCRSGRRSSSGKGTGLSRTERAIRPIPRNLLT